MTQSMNGNLSLNMKALVVADDATRRKIIFNYLKRNRLENPATLDDDILPQAIFWLKKKVGFPEDWRK